MLQYAEPIIVLITRGNATAENFDREKCEMIETIRIAAEAGVSYVQIREKRLPARSLFELAVDAVAAAGSTGTKILVNGRFDIALAANAHGVHLPGSSIPAEAVRRVCPSDFIVSAAVHSLDRLAAAKSSGVDIAVLSPIFATPGKGIPLGTDVLSKAVESFEPLPIVGLGGVDETNYRDVLKTGAAGFAAIRFLNSREGIAEVDRYLTSKK